MKHIYLLLILSVGLLLIPSVYAGENESVELKAKATDCSEPGTNFVVTIEFTAKKDGNYSVRLEERETKYKFVSPPSGERYDEDLKADEKKIFEFTLKSDKSNLSHGDTFKLNYKIYRNGIDITPDEDGEITIEVKKKDDDDGFIPGFEIGVFITALIISCLILQKKRYCK